MSALKNFRKAMAKKDDKFNIGFAPIPDWISTGNMSLNAIISGDPRKGWPVGRTSMLSGLSGTGKSFLVANAAREAQAKGYFVVYLDTENSVGDEFMENIGVNLDEDHFMPISVYSVEEVTSFLSELFKNTEKDEKICLIIDSLSNLETEKDMEKFEAGNIAYGQGLKEKLYKGLVRNINTKIGHRDMLCLINTHMYVNGSDVYGNPILKPSCGSSTIFIPSVGVELAKSDLKEGKDQVGITIKAKTYKTRYTSLGRKCQFDLPWDTGMNPYDGLLPLMELEGAVTRNGAWYSIMKGGEEIKFQKKNMEDHIDAILEAYAELQGEFEEAPESDTNAEMLNQSE